MPEAVNNEQTTVDDATGEPLQETAADNNSAKIEAPSSGQIDGGTDIDAGTTDGNPNSSIVLITDKSERLRWTPELHAAFVKSVESCGGALIAKPKEILEDMNIPGLSLNQCKSHLQKYRMLVINNQERGDRDRKRRRSSVEWQNQHQWAPSPSPGPVAAPPAANWALGGSYAAHRSPWAGQPPPEGYGSATAVPTLAVSQPPAPSWNPSILPRTAAAANSFPALNRPSVLDTSHLQASADPLSPAPFRPPLLPPTGRTSPSVTNWGSALQGAGTGSGLGNGGSATGNMRLKPSDLTALTAGASSLLPPDQAAAVASTLATAQGPAAQMAELIGAAVQQQLGSVLEIQKDLEKLLEQNTNVLNHLKEKTSEIYSTTQELQSRSLLLMLTALMQQNHDNKAGAVAAIEPAPGLARAISGSVAPVEPVGGEPADNNTNNAAMTALLPLLKAFEDQMAAGGQQNQ